jgi:hypothetical protein
MLIEAEQQHQGGDYQDASADADKAAEDPGEKTDDENEGNLGHG